MDEDSQTGNAIVPEDKNKQLSLPMEMIQRGLELARRIEQKLGITPITKKTDRKEYTIQCYLNIMEWSRKADGSYKLGETDKPITNSPVYLMMFVDINGVHISCAAKDLNVPGIEGNEDRYRLLNAFNDLNSFTIPFSSLLLFYTLTHGMDETHSNPMTTHSHLSKDAMKNFSFRMGPSGGHPGYKGPVTKEKNPYFDANRDCVETVIIYISLLEDTNLRQGLIVKNPPLKLTCVVIDRNGQEDRIASRELYHAILETKEPNSSQK